MHILYVIFTIAYMLGFIAASIRAGSYTCDKLGVSSKSITACIVMTAGIALLWFPIMVEDIIRLYITRSATKEWDS